jgi:hypothetical protein
LTPVVLVVALVLKWIALDDEEENEHEAQVEH